MSKRRGAQVARREGSVEKLVAGGAGLVRTADGASLIPRVAPGERVVFEAGRPFARLVKVLERSPHRVEPACEHAARCGGCDLLHLDPEGQRDARLGILREALGGFSGLPPITYREAAPLERGRTRVRWHARRVGREVVVGYHELGSHTVVSVKSCLALDPRLEAALPHARAILEGAEGQGDLHGALGAERRPVLAISWKGTLPPSSFGTAERLVRAGSLAGVSLHLDGASVPARIGDPRPVSEGLDGLPLTAAIGGFAQASDRGDHVLVERVVSLAAPAGKRIVELHAGSGNLTCALAPLAVQLTAIELSFAACTALRENLAARGLAARVKVVEADAERHELTGGVELVVLDPPRTGALGAVGAIARARPRQVVYVSCDPATLARDLATLLPAGYRVDAIEAIDLFPGTSHLETVVSCVRG